MNTRHILAVAATVLMAASGRAQAAEFSFAVEPNFPPEHAEEIYQPLMNYLGRTTGHTFKLQTSRNYHFYWRDLRANAPADFVYEEPHFADYRIQRYGYVPLVRTAEPTVYALLAQPDYAERGLNGLVGYRVVAMPSPSLGFVALTQMYKNPLSQPEIKSEATSWREGVEIVFAGEGEAAIVPERIADLYPNLVEIQRSADMPGAAVLAAPDVDEEVRHAVREALLTLHEDEDLYQVLVEIGAKRFVPASAEEFAGAEQLLRGVFGFQPAPTAP